MVAGLGAAHKAGIVHRDVKPANIFISLDARALIGDFGICKIEGQTQITRRDQLVGTPNYLAPEQILGDPVSPATDVFALGALFYVITVAIAMPPKKTRSVPVIRFTHVKRPAVSLLRKRSASVVNKSHQPHDPRNTPNTSVAADAASVDAPATP